MSDDTIICRCEDLSAEVIRSWMDKGYTTLDEIKRVTRCGMGQCQGRTCRPLVMQEISRKTGQRIGDMQMPTFRPPLEPLRIQAILEHADNE
ncbi:MAG: (2Fe-2S)-binding protein [Desulfovermiculus sp.]|nr:(2Fe-2S)-binding protein [Desulfovermiculus sp.]